MKKRLMDDFKAAMKSRDEIRKNTINMVRAAIKQVEVDTRTELTDDEILPIINDLARDLINQSGLQNLRVMAEPNDRLPESG